MDLAILPAKRWHTNTYKTQKEYEEANLSTIWSYRSPLWYALCLLWCTPQNIPKEANLLKLSLNVFVMHDFCAIHRRIICFTEDCVGCKRCKYVCTTYLLSVRVLFRVLFRVWNNPQHGSILLIVLKKKLYLNLPIPPCQRSLCSK